MSRVVGRPRLLATARGRVAGEGGQALVLLVGLVVLVLYGRSGVLKSRQFQTIWPWISPVRRPSGRSRPGPAVAGSRRATG